MSQDRCSNNSIEGLSTVEAKKLRIILYIAALLLVVGLVSPMMTIEKFIIVRNTFSVLSGVVELFKSGQFLLSAIIFGFSIVIPILKMLVLFRLTNSASQHCENTHRYLKLMHDYGRWSMLDVFVVALLIVTVKLGPIADVQVHFGLFAFCSAMLVTSYVTSRIVNLTTK
jgi:paraquat-inducible protein A